MGYSSKQEEERGLLLSPINGKEESEKNGSERSTLAFQPKSQDAWGPCAEESVGESCRVVGLVPHPHSQHTPCLGS